MAFHVDADVHNKVAFMTKNTSNMFYITGFMEFHRVQARGKSVATHISRKRSRHVHTYSSEKRKKHCWTNKWLAFDEGPKPMAHKD
jgi:hypothetical protein